MPDMNEDYKSMMTEQFTNSIRAVAELTQSIHDLQVEVEDHSDHILQAKSELVVLKDKLATLTRLVQGEGLTDSISSAVVELQTKLKGVEQWQRDSRDDRRDGKTTSTTIIVLVISSIVTMLISIGSVVLPTLLKGSP